jgi:monoamine oxidase
MLTRRQWLLGSSAALVAAAAPRLAWGRTEADVIVIGAGLAGLNAALILEREGLKVTVVEAQQRIGGRLWTLDELPGRPEAGGQTIGASYGRVRSMAARLGVGLVDEPIVTGVSDRRGALYRINGQTVRQQDWPSATANLTEGDERAVGPAGLGSFYDGKMERLADREAWLDPAVIQRLDGSLAEGLTRAGASPEARRLISANLNGNGIHSFSALQAARASIILRSGPGATSSVAGGNQRLPEAMAASLRGAVRLGEAVAGISEEPGLVRIRLTSGRTLQAPQVICTLPFAALRQLPVDGAFGPALATDIAALGYTRVSFVFLKAKTAFWQHDGLPDTVWSDDPLLGRVFVASQDPPVLKTWLYGPFADHLDRLPEAEAGAATIRRLEAARPSARVQLSVARVFSWCKVPWARGIYHHMMPGQGASHAAAVNAVGQRLHFAGEHMARVHSGMEGAMEAGERAAYRVLRLR